MSPIEPSLKVGLPKAFAVGCGGAGRLVTSKSNCALSTEPGCCGREECSLRCWSLDSCALVTRLY